MKKFKKLIPALAMLLVSASMMGTSTFAWFSMNTQVSAVGMQVKAVAEDGILISNADKTTWSNTATAKVTTANLVPTSTAGTTTPAWAHNTSTNADEAQANQAASSYEDLSLTWSNSNSHGEGFVDLTGGTAGSRDSNEKIYVLLNEFYIKSSGNALTLGSGQTYADLYINDVTVTSAGAFLKIDNSLRVLVVVGSAAYIYAPVIDQAGGTTTMTYNFKQNTAVTAYDATAAAGFDKTTGTTSIANTDAGATLAQVYIYFEGEDANCKSTNISGVTTQNLSVSVNFGLLPTHTP
ncbi:MAG: hypothetical protein IK088_07405 [Lachnospiraceae bacterium]|nr:hypothetical protein [Lachnospiraceae bacterium]